jgi:cytolethal distending toxin subunit A
MMPSRCQRNIQSHIQPPAGRLQEATDRLRKHIGIMNRECSFRSAGWRYNVRTINTTIRSVAVFRRARRLVLAGATAAIFAPGLLAAAPTQASPFPAAPSPSIAGTYMLKNQHSGKCLTIAGGSININAPGVQYDCDGDPSRRWTLTDVSGNGSGVEHIQNVHSSECLTVAGGSADINVPTVQYPCDDDLSRRWTLAQHVSLGEIAYGIQNFHSGWCLQVAGLGTNNNDAILQSGCGSFSNVLWILIPT